jgi:Initiation factor 2 subunit family
MNKLTNIFKVLIDFEILVKLFPYVLLLFNSTTENVDLAGKAICQEASKKIASGDVILTYGYSSLLLQILLKAFNEDNKKFRVVVLDSSPRSEGLQLLRRLVSAKIPSVYMLISGASYIMPEVCTKQFTFSVDFYNYRMYCAYY